MRKVENYCETIASPFDSSNMTYIKTAWGNSYIYEFYLSRTEKKYNIGFTSDFLSERLAKLSYEEKCAMQYAILFHLDKIVIFSENEDQDLVLPEERTLHFLPYTKLKNIYPKTVRERIDMFLEEIAKIYPNFGESISFGKNEDHLNSKFNKYVFFSEKDNAACSWNFLQMLQDYGLLKKYTGERSTDGSTYYLTIDAWKRIEVIDENNQEKKIFIAMAFDEEDFLHKYECDVKKAVRNCGYEPIIIKEKEHNNYIMEEIEYDIRHSAGLIADLTKGKGGVYFEAGIAKGMGKQVILTCYDTEKERNAIHFDTKQINTIFWKNENEEMRKSFIERIEKRIKATVSS